MNLLDTLFEYLAGSGFGHFHWTNGVMMLVGLLFIFLAIKKGFEPLLLVPIGFGILIGNIPYDASKLPLSVYDGPVSEDDLAVFSVSPASVVLADGTTITMREARERLGITRLDDDAVLAVIEGAKVVRLDAIKPIEGRYLGYAAVESGNAVLVNTHSVLSARMEIDGPGIYRYGQGRYIFVEELREDGRYPELWSLERQDPHNASVFWWLFAGVGLAGFYPPLIFLGIGVLTDFGPMLGNPKTLLLGAAAQFGIFGSLLGAYYIFGFSIEESASIGIIGGADGPTAIFTCSQLAPDLLGAVALAAYSYMAMVPIIQPPIIKALTTKSERSIRMPQVSTVSRPIRVGFPIAGFLLTAMIAPGGLPLLGMLFFGNLLRESLVTDRLAKTAGGPFIDIVT
ncbi:MAG: sodium ion-translocating decarboxylase subunit beta, partial [Planctomycetota bacterium]